MSGRKRNHPSGGGAGRAMPAPQPTETLFFAQLPVILGLVFVCALPIPGLISLPEGASLALVTMLVSLPIWYWAAHARVTPFDLTATRAIAVVLACAGFLIFWSLLSIFGAVAPMRASRYLATLIAAFALYFLVRGTVTRLQIAHYVDALAVGLAATAAVSLLAYEVGGLHEIIFRGTDRAAGFFKNPNQFGMAISTTIPAVLALILSEERRRPLRAVCLILMLLGLVASGSKTNFLLAWASILAVVSCYSWIYNTGSRRVGMMVLSVAGNLVFAGLGIAALTLLNPRALAIMMEFFGGDGEVDSLLTRSYLWTYSVDQFLIDPVFGQGAGQRLDIFYREADVSHSHNVLLDYMRTLGAPGLIAVSVMIGTVVIVCLQTSVRALQSARGAPADRLICLGLSLSCLSYVAANMSSDSFGPSTSPFFWLFAYLSFAARSLMRRIAAVGPQLQRQSEEGSFGRFPDLLPQAAFEAANQSAKLSSKWLALWLVLIGAALALALSVM
jgi:O-Antigen ligase